MNDGVQCHARNGDGGRTRQGGHDLLDDGDVPRNAEVDGLVKRLSGGLGGGSRAVVGKDRVQVGNALLLGVAARCGTFRANVVHGVSFGLSGPAVL